MCTFIYALFLTSPTLISGRTLRPNASNFQCILMLLHAALPELSRYAPHCTEVQKILKQISMVERVFDNDPEGKRMKLCLTIGVAKAERLAHLPGAITAAHEMGDWARKSGFKTEVITDEDGDTVTISRIRDVLLALLPENDLVELFILHFAGHGLRSGAEQNIWLTSDWYTEMKAISVEGLRRQLYRHGIKSLSIFNDACRALPRDIETADIQADIVLPRGPYEPKSPIIDRFNAAVDGEQAYMIKGDGIAPSRCIFSTVLLEGLSGIKEKAFDRFQTDLIIPESLDLFSKERLREIGVAYDLNCIPENQTGNPRDHAIYFKKNEGQQNFLPLKWPEPSVVEKTRGASAKDIQAEVSNYHFGKIHRNFKNALDLAAVSREGFNVMVRGAIPRRIWSSSYVEKGPVEFFLGAAYRVELLKSDAVQILVEFENGVFASAVVYHGLNTLISVTPDGTVSWTCVSQWESPSRSLNRSISTIADLQSGNLSADAVDSIAADMRSEKHVNPVLGAIASYLYDYTGDIDSISRMAFFYCAHAQSIPFDIAFLAMLPAHDLEAGEVRVDVPPVSARPLTVANNRLPHWVTRETPQTSGYVAGKWPWLHQGWQFIEAPEPQEKAAAENLRDVVRFLLPNQFSSFKEEGARLLINKFHLEASA